MIASAYIAASFFQVSITESGFNDIDSIPWFISQAAKSGWSDGPCPQMPMYFPFVRQAQIASDSSPLTDSSRSSKSLAIADSGPDAILKVQDANSRNHCTLLDNAGSPRLHAMLETIIDMPIIVRSFSIYTHAQLEQSLHHHQDLTLAIEARDGDLACQVMQLHLRVSYLRFMRHRSEYKRVA